MTNSLLLLVSFSSIFSPPVTLCLQGAIVVQVYKGVGSRRFVSESQRVYIFRKEYLFVGREKAAGGEKKNERWKEHNTNRGV